MGRIWRICRSSLRKFNTVAQGTDPATRVKIPRYKTGTWGTRTEVEFREARLGVVGLGGGDAEGFHFAVEVGAFEAESAGGAGHIPAIFF